MTEERGERDIAKPQVIEGSLEGCLPDGERERGGERDTELRCFRLFSCMSHVVHVEITYL